MKTITKGKSKRKLDSFFNKFCKKPNKAGKIDISLPVSHQRKFLSNEAAPKCSNCDLEMKLIENKTLWFCPLGCTKKLKDADASFINFYNAKLKKVLENKKLYADVETILDEQKAVLIVGGKLSEPEAESRIMNFDNLREIVLSV